MLGKHSTRRTSRTARRLNAAGARPVAAVDALHRERRLWDALQVPVVGKVTARKHAVDFFELQSPAGGGVAV